MAELRPHAVAFPTAWGYAQATVFTRVRGEVCPLPGDTGLTFGRFTGADPAPRTPVSPATPLGSAREATGLTRVALSSRGTRSRCPRPSCHQVADPPAVRSTGLARQTSDPKEVTTLQLTALLDALVDERDEVATRNDLPCRVHDPELWFAESPADVEHAKSLCHACPSAPRASPVRWNARSRGAVWGGELVLPGVVVPRKRPRGRPRKSEAAA